VDLDEHGSSPDISCRSRSREASTPGALEPKDIPTQSPGKASAGLAPPGWGLPVRADRACRVPAGADVSARPRSGRDCRCGKHRRCVDARVVEYANRERGLLTSACTRNRDARGGERSRAHLNGSWWRPAPERTSLPRTVRSGLSKYLFEMAHPALSWVHMDIDDAGEGQDAGEDGCQRRPCWSRWEGYQVCNAMVMGRGRAWRPRCSRRRRFQDVPGERDELGGQMRHIYGTIGRTSRLTSRAHHARGRTRTSASCSPPGRGSRVYRKVPHQVLTPDS
jgi:hypothetical protein